MPRSPARKRGKGLLALGGTAIVIAGFAYGLSRIVTPGLLHDQAIAALERQTGRDIHASELKVALFPWPSIVARQVSISNMPAAHDPVMFKADEVRARIALVPLFTRHIRLEDVTILHPNLLLERETDGAANWHFTPRPEPETRDENGAPSSGDNARWTVELGSARIENAHLVLQDAKYHRTGDVDIDHAVFDHLIGDTPGLNITGHHGDGHFTLRGQIGDLSALTTPGATSLWPLQLVATIGKSGTEGTFRLEGHIGDVSTLAGYRLTFFGQIAHLQDLNRLFPHAGLPDINQIQTEFAIEDHNGIPALRRAHLTTGHAVLPHDVEIDKFSLEAPTENDPIRIQASGRTTGQFNPGPLDLKGKSGSLAQAAAAWHDRLTTVMPVTLDAHGLGGNIHVAGTLGNKGSGIVIDAKAKHITTPNHRWALDDVSLTGKVESADGASLKISDFKVQSRQANLVANLALVRGVDRLPALSGQIQAELLDLDAMQQAPNGNALQETTNPPAPNTTPQQSTKDTTTQASTSQSNTPHFSVSFLHKADLDLDLSVQSLKWRGTTYTDAAAKFGLTNGNLKIDGIRAVEAATQLGGSFGFDDSEDVPHITATFAPLVLPAGIVEQALGAPPLLEGQLQLVGALDTQGATRDARLASLSGHIGASLVNGSVRSESLGHLMGKPAALLMGREQIALRCFGTHMTIDNGVANLSALGLQAERLSFTGTGRVGLASQTLDLHIVPVLSFGGTGTTSAMTIGGTLSEPEPQFAPQSGAGRFSLTIGPNIGTSDPCPTVLDAAREGLPGPVAPAPSAPQKPHVGDILRGLGILH